jgi:hypothetical protein
MKVLNRQGKNYRLPSVLNPFQERMYIHLIDWKRQHITDACGTSGGESYDAILPEDIVGQRPLIYPSIRTPLQNHQQKFPFRIHKFFNHMASSQAANINLFLPILLHPQASVILRQVKPDLARIATDQLDCGYRIEFWDEPFGRLGDKTEVSGTDADIAIAYYNDEGLLCLWLIEHKLTEAEFTNCGGFKSKGRLPRHDCKKSFPQLVQSSDACYYHEAKKFEYWNITSRNQTYFPNYSSHIGCPFKGGTNQLWRNLLLTLAVEQDEHQPYEYAAFSVVRHPQNTALDRTINQFQSLIAGNPKFTTFTSAEVIAAAEIYADHELKEWISWYKGLYKL